MMKRISAAACVALALSVAVGPAVPRASESARQPEPPAAWREVTLGVGLNVKSSVISLDGFLHYGEADRLRTVEILSAPNPGDCVRRISAVARVIQSVSRSVVRHWWGRYSLANSDEGR